eukprot:IDg3739t1
MAGAVGRVKSDVLDCKAHTINRVDRRGWGSARAAPGEKMTRTKKPELGITTTLSFAEFTAVALNSKKNLTGIISETMNFLHYIPLPPFEMLRIS